MAETMVADALMESFVIEGGQPLHGRVTAAGNKNGVLPILAACVMTTEPVVLHNVPRIRDVDTMLALIDDLGADVQWIGPNDVRVHAADIRKAELDPELCSHMRASFLLAGPLLVRAGTAIVAPPGGDVIGRRRLDPHIHGVRELGGEVEGGDPYGMRTDGVKNEDLISILPTFARLGVRVEGGDGTVRVPPGQELYIEDDIGGHIPKIEDGPWPAFPSDCTSIALTVATQARGTVLLFEK